MREKMQWLQDETSYRAFFEGILAAQGEDALAHVYMSGKPAANPAPTRYFCRDLPMLCTGRMSHTTPKFTEYLVPARAALMALEIGLVICSCRQRKTPKLE